MFCELCGEEIPSGGESCPFCGCPVENNPNEGGYELVEDTSVKYKTGSFLWLYRILIVLAALYFVFDSANDALNTFKAGSIPLTLMGYPATLVLASVFALAALIVWCFFIYRAWNLVQEDDMTGTSPGNAVFLNFVPIFNCYWFFVTHLGLTETLNRYCERRYIETKRIGKLLAFVCGSFALLLAIVFAAILVALLKYDMGSRGDCIVFFTTFGLRAAGLVLLLRLYASFAKTAEVILAYKKSEENWDDFDFL